MVDGKNEKALKNEVFQGLVFSIKSQPSNLNHQLRECLKSGKPHICEVNCMFSNFLILIRTLHFLKGGVNFLFMG
jgi:hypothetical protein